ncbi:hypothetical protein ACFQ3Z_44080 [Streptomyces nogalater]
MPPDRTPRRGGRNRLRVRVADGTWEPVFTALMAQADADEEWNWAVSVDFTVVRAHSTRPGPHQGPRPVSRATTPSDAPAAGRPRRSVSPRTTGAGPGVPPHRRAGGDTPAFTAVMARLRVPRREADPGPDRTWS